MDWHAVYLREQFRVLSDDGTIGHAEVRNW